MPKSLLRTGIIWCFFYLLIFSACAQMKNESQTSESSKVVKSEQTQRLQKVDDIVYYTYLHYYDPDQLRQILIAQDTSKETVDTSIVGGLRQLRYIFWPQLDKLTFEDDRILLKSTFYCNNCTIQKVNSIGVVTYSDRNNKYEITFLLKDLLTIAKLPFIDSIDHRIALKLELTAP